MDKVYANLIINGLKTLENVLPLTLRESVETLLKERGYINS